MHAHGLIPNATNNTQRACYTDTLLTLTIPHSHPTTLHALSPTPPSPIRHPTNQSHPHLPPPLRLPTYPLHLRHHPLNLVFLPPPNLHPPRRAHNIQTPPLPRQRRRRIRTP
jgi:hypothetical protein